MAKAIIKSKTGALMTIEGSKTEVAEILGVLERTAVASQVRKVAAAQQVQKREQKKATATSDLVVKLREHGFLDRPKGLADISRALEEKGFFYPVTSLSGVVLGLVKKGELSRKKVEGKWVYGK